MQEAHQHPTLMILPPKKHSQDLDFSLLRAWTKPIHSTIRSQMAKARQQIFVAFYAEGSGGQPFGGSDDRLDAHLGMPIGFSRWLSKTAVGLREVIGDQQQIVENKTQKLGIRKAIRSRIRMPRPNAFIKIKRKNNMHY